MKVYCPRANQKLHKIKLAAQIYEARYEHVDVPFSHTNKQFNNRYPNCILPAMQIEPNQYIFGTNTILTKLAQKSLQKQSTFTIARIQQFLELSEKDIQPLIGILFIAQNKIAQINSDQQTNAIKKLTVLLKKINDDLRLNTFLVGDHLTIADIVIFKDLQISNKSMLKQFATAEHVRRWMKHIESISAQFDDYIK